MKNKKLIFFDKYIEQKIKTQNERNELKKLLKEVILRIKKEKTM